MTAAVTPEELSRLVRWVKIVLGVNAALTVVNGGVLYALLVFVVAEPAAVDGVDPFSEADRLAAEVAAGHRVVLLCEGDVSLFATSSYVLLALRRRHPRCPVRLLPGISAVAAAAAAGSWPLALQREGLLIRPTPQSPAELETLLERAAAEGLVLALLKLGHRWGWVQPLLERRGLLEQSLFARRVGWPDQLVAPAAAVAAGEMPYFSLLLIRQGWSVVLP